MLSTTNRSQSASQATPPQSYTTGWGNSPLGYFLLALPIVAFSFVWKTYAINIPKWDDHALRAFLFFFDQETTFSGKVYQVFRQHNEHRIVFDRIITLLDYWLFGKLSYEHLMLVGNLSLIGLLAVFTATLRRSGKPIIYAIPVAFLLFNLSHWENMYWGMAAPQNFSVVLWIMAAFYWLSYTRHWGLALAAAVLATITSGNGIVVWPIGFLLLLLRTPVNNGPVRARVFRPLIGWLVSGAVVIGLYFTGFKKPDDIIYEHPGLGALLKGWFAFIGAAAEAIPFGSPLRASILLGALLVLITLGLFCWTIFVNRSALVQMLNFIIAPKKANAAQIPVVSSRTLFFWSGAVFLLGTAAIVAWARTVFGIDLLITSRYKMYSLTVLTLLYVYILTGLPPRQERWLMIGGTVGGLLFAGLAYLSFLDETIWWRHWFTTSQFNRSYSTNRPVVRIDSITSRYTNLAPAFYDSMLPTLYGPANQSLVHVQVNKTATGYDIQNTTMPAQGLVDAGNYLLVRSAKRLYLYPVRQNQQTVLQASFQPNRLLTTGFRGDIPTGELDAGTYQLFILTVSEDGQSILYPTNQTIASAGPPATARPKNW